MKKGNTKAQAKVISEGKQHMAYIDRCDDDTVVVYSLRVQFVKRPTYLGENNVGSVKTKQATDNSLYA